MSHWAMSVAELTMPPSPTVKLPNPGVANA
jgi:hypothetical protein